jgi:hypothetical protein
MDRADFLRLMFGGAAMAVLPRMAAAGPEYDFRFTRLMYESGDWDVDARMPSNIITSLIDYTSLRVDPKEHVIALSDPKMRLAPFCYLAGHKLVQFSPAERRNFEAYLRSGGFIFVDDCNHDIDGLFAKSFEAQMASIFGPKALRKIPNTHPLYSSFFRFSEPPTTSARKIRMKTPRAGSVAKAWTEVRTPERTRKVPSRLRLNPRIASSTVQVFSASRFSTTIAECSSAVPISQGSSEAFSTGSQNQ